MYKCLYSVHHQQKDTLLAKVIMPCFALLHGNAGAERNLSMNKKIAIKEQTSLEEENKCRLLKIALPCCCGGNSTGVNSTSALLCGAKAVHVKYKQQLEDLRRVGLLVTEYYTK